MIHIQQDKLKVPNFVQMEKKFIEEVKFLSLIIDFCYFPCLMIKFSADNNKGNHYAKNYFSH